MRKTILRLAAIALAAALAAALHTAAQPAFKAVGKSTCSLPVESTMTIEYPLGSAPQTIKMASSPSEVPTVETDAQDPASKKMRSTFVKLTLHGTLGGKPLVSRLNGRVKSFGEVSDVEQAGPGEFKRGKHGQNLNLIYTLDEGQRDAVSFENKRPIRVEGTLDSLSPTGAVYRMVGGPVDLVDPKNKKVGTLHSLENRVLR